MIRTRNLLIWSQTRSCGATESPWRSHSSKIKYWPLTGATDHVTWGTPWTRTPRTRYCKVAGSSSCRSGGGRIVCSRINFLCWCMMRQVTAKHTCTLRMRLCIKWHCKLVHGCIVYTERAPIRNQLHAAPAMQQPNSAVSGPFGWLFKNKQTNKNALQRTTTPLESDMTRTQWVCSRAENCAI